MDPSNSGNATSKVTWKPSEYLAYAENLAINIRKLLRTQADAGGLNGNPASKDDAERLAELVETIARFGQRQSASVAIETVEQVEQLLPLLINEIESAGRPEGSV